MQDIFVTLVKVPDRIPDMWKRNAAYEYRKYYLLEDDITYEQLYTPEER